MEVTLNLKKAGLYAVLLLVVPAAAFFLVHPGKGKGTEASPTATLAAVTKAAETPKVRGKNFKPLPATARPTPAPTATPETKLVAVVNDNNVRLRGGPGTTFAIEGKAQKGQEFKVVGRNQDSSWLEVCCWRGKKVWVYAKLVDVSTEVVNPAPTPAGPKPLPPKEGFSKNAYVPLDCGPYAPGERVIVEVEGPDGEKLSPGWFFQKGSTANADAAGWIHLLLVTKDWPVGTSMVTCRGEKGTEYKVLVPIVEDSGDAVRLAAGATPSSVSAKTLKSGTVYVRVMAPGFKPTELVNMDITPPGQGAQPFGQMQADWVGEAAFIVVLDPGDPAGEWVCTITGKETQHKETVRFTVR